MVAGGADLLYGDEGSDNLWGYGGNDSLTGGYGGDALDGGYGDDWSAALDGYIDNCVGGPGNDTGSGDSNHLMYL